MSFAAAELGPTSDLFSLLANELLLPCVSRILARRFAKPNYCILYIPSQ